MQENSIRSKYKVLYCYPYFAAAAYPDMKQWVEEYVDLLNKSGFNIEPFCITIDPPNDPLGFGSLSYQWRHAEKKLMHLYEKLENKLAEGFDVLVNAVGINLHPEFVEKLPVFTVFCCADDPENSNNLSKPAAYAYDLSLASNIAEIDTYRTWGVKNVEWLPIGLWPHYYDPNLTEEELIKSLTKRDIDLFLLGDRNSPYRIDRMIKLENAFPDAHFYGKGWKRGLLPFGQEISYLMRSKIGPNIHNSTGPINLRLYTLPANGVMQVCDNKKNLGSIFELGKEIMGFDTVAEGIDMCRYYLTHDNERIEIALNGWRRVMRDYTEEKIFQRIVEAVDRVFPGKRTEIASRKLKGQNITLNHKRKTFWTSLPGRIQGKLKFEIKKINKK